MLLYSCAAVRGGDTVETGPAFRIVAYSNSMGSESNDFGCEHVYSIKAQKTMLEASVA